MLHQPLDADLTPERFPLSNASHLQGCSACAPHSATRILHPTPPVRVGPALALASPSAMYLVEDVMSRELVTLKPGDDLALAESVMHLGRIRHLPVVSPSGHLLGLVTHRELLRAFASRDGTPAAAVRAEEMMTRQVVTVSPKTTLRRALVAMLHNKFGCLPVVDVSGALVGIVTEYDLVKFASRLAQEFDEIEKLARSRS